MTRKKLTKKKINPLPSSSPSQSKSASKAKFPHKVEWLVDIPLEDWPWLPTVWLDENDKLICLEPVPHPLPVPQTRDPNEIPLQEYLLAMKNPSWGSSWLLKNVEFFVKNLRLEPWLIIKNKSVQQAVRKLQQCLPVAGFDCLLTLSLLKLPRLHPELSRTMHDT